VLPVSFPVEPAERVPGFIAIPGRSVRRRESREDCILDDGLRIQCYLLLFEDRITPLLVYARHGLLDVSERRLREHHPLFTVMSCSGSSCSRPEDGAEVRNPAGVGSEIFYDLLLSHQLDPVTIDLWVTAGAQKSLFAEMLLFADMAQPLPADTSAYTLKSPPPVKKWSHNFCQQAGSPAVARCGDDVACQNPQNSGRIVARGLSQRVKLYSGAGARPFPSQ